MTTHIQRVVNDVTVVGTGGVVLGVTLTDIEMWLKIILLVATIIFVILGSCLRMKKLKSEDDEGVE